MTKEGLAKQIIQTVKNCVETNERELAIEYVTNWLDTLEPKDREGFARWGNPNEQSTIEDCWK
jgi:hypothetical protein